MRPVLCLVVCALLLTSKPHEWVRQFIRHLGGGDIS